jgi:outer membrane protein
MNNIGMTTYVLKKMQSSSSKRPIKSSARTFMGVILALIGFVFPHYTHAQQLLTLQDAIAIALQNNYDIQLAESDSARLGLDYTYRNVVFLPRLNANLGTTWTQNNQQQEFSDGTDRKGDVATNNLNASVTLNWTLFDGMKMFALKKKAEEYAALGVLGVKNQVVNTIAEVINTYYIIVRQKQQLKAIEEQMQINQTRVDLSKRRLEIGMGSRPEYLQSQIDYNAQVSAKLHQETYIKELKAILNQRINPVPAGLDNPLPVDYEVSDTIPIDFDITLEAIRNNLEESSPALQITRKNLDIAGISLKEIKADQYPVVQFNSAYNFSLTNNDVALNPFLPLTNQNRGFNYGFSATIPILNYRNTHRLIKQAELNIGYQNILYNSERSALNLRVVNAYNTYELQKEALALEESNILLAKENVSISMETYRLGSTTFIQLREAEKSLEDAYDRLIAARYNAKVAETELLRLRGDLVK